MNDTIFALSSGPAPAAIAVIRISGPQAGQALERIAGKLPAPRSASYKRLRDEAGETLDHALVLWFPGSATATGEDLAELHCHGGRAVVAAVEEALAEMSGLRRATPGEFTRRAFMNGRIDLSEAEGLADLLAAETELQRRSALTMAEGAVSRRVERWREDVLRLSAMVEAVLDFGDEDDVEELPGTFRDQLHMLEKEIHCWLGLPRAELLREGFKVVLAGPPNSGKSTLFNTLVEKEAAITSPLEGTTRDVLVRAVSISGVPFQFVDTAGLRDKTDDFVEAIGIGLAREAARDADLVLWLGPEGQGPAGSWEVAAQADRVDQLAKAAPRHRVSAVTGEGMTHLRDDLVAFARATFPKPGEVAIGARQRDFLSQARDALARSRGESDGILIAEELRLVRQAFDSLLGRTGTEDMLDALFGRFCIGK